MIILFRHGEGDHNVNPRFSCSKESEAELTPNGRLMVKNSAERLKIDIQHENVVVYSSPLLRTRQTAEIICEVFNIDFSSVIIDDRLIEVQMGKYDEKPVSEFPWDVYNIYAAKTYGGEDYPDVEKRMLSMIDEIKDIPIVLLVSHALPIRVMRRMLTSIDDKIKVAEYAIIQ